jgi:hypothetical protein
MPVPAPGGLPPLTCFTPYFKLTTAPLACDAPSPPQAALEAGNVALTAEGLVSHRSKDVRKKINRLRKVRAVYGTCCAL